MQYLLFEDHSHFDLLPLTFTRPVFDLRVGIDKLSEKWARAIGSVPGQCSYSYLKTRFDRFDPSQETLWLNGKFIPNPELLRDLEKLSAPNFYVLNAEEEILAFQCKPEKLKAFDGIVNRQMLEDAGLQPSRLDVKNELAIRFPTDIFQLNGRCIRLDFESITEGRKSEPITDKHSIVYGADNVFLEEGVQMRANIINAEDGPIYLGKQSTLQEGAIIHNTHAICAHSTISMGAKLRGDTTIGPWSKAGGEIGNSVIQGYSNKGHDGYMGNSVLGYWCNIGADSNTSNLKNNYSEVKLWNYPKGGFRKTGSMFCGLILGDHSKCGINTMFNTGTVVGVSANIFGAGYPRNFIPSFSWGGSGGLSVYQLKKVFEVAKAVMSRRNIEFDTVEEEILRAVFEHSKAYRNF